MALPFLNRGDSKAVTKSKTDAIIESGGLDSSTVSDTTDTRTLLNQTAVIFEKAPLDQFQNLDGGQEVRDKINDLARGPAWINEYNSTLSDFKLNREWSGGEVKVASDNYTTVRASSKTRWNVAGNLETIGSNVIPYTYDPISHAPLGINTERQVTNLVTQSEFQTGIIGTGLITVTTFPRLPNNTGLAVGYNGSTATTISKGPTLTAGLVYAVSLFVEMDDGLPPVFGSATGSSPLNDFTILTEAGIGNPTDYMVSHCGGSLYRVTRIRSATGGTGHGILKYANNSTRTFKISGMQIEVGRKETSYIPTGASQVTRAADQVSRSAASAGWSGTENTIKVSGRTAGQIPQILGMTNVQYASAETSANLTSLTQGTSRFTIGSTLVTNGQFTSDVTGWDGSPSSAVTWVTGTLRGVATSSPGGIISPGFSVTSGKSYRFKIRLKGDANYSSLQFSLRRTSAQGSNISNVVNPSVTVNYADYTIDVTATATVSDAAFYLRFTTNGNAVNLEYVEVYELTDPAIFFDDFKGYISNPEVLAAGWTNTSSSTHNLVSGIGVDITTTSINGLTRSFNSIIGNPYRVTVSYIHLSGSSGGRLRSSNTATGTGYLNTTFGSTGIYSFIIVPTVSNTFVNLASNVAADTVRYASILIEAVATDISPSSNHPTIVGVIPRQVVASGATLASKSGFSVANYVRHNRNSAWDFGTGTFTVKAWIKNSSYTGTRPFWSYGQEGTPNYSRSFYVDNLGALKLIQNASPNIISTNDGVMINNKWQQVILTQDNSNLKLAVDGTVLSSRAVYNMTPDGIPFAVWGRNIASSSVFTGGEIALESISASGMTDEQIAASYEAEKGFFEPNAPFTIPSLASGLYIIPTDQAILTVDDGTINERYRFFRNVNGNIIIEIDDGGIEQASLNLGLIANDTSFNVALSAKLNQFIACLNGGTPISDTSGTLPTVNSLKLGYSPAGEQLMGTIDGIEIIPRALTGPELQTLTTP